jgi:superoxide dismutase, Cu-Zn family
MHQKGATMKTSALLFVPILAVGLAACNTPASTTGSNELQTVPEAALPADVRETINEFVPDSQNNNLQATSIGVAKLQTKNLPANVSTANFVNAAGEASGWLLAVSSNKKVFVLTNLTGSITDGNHGIHVHAGGECSSATGPFSGAKAHYDPELTNKHSTLTASRLEGHAGDLGNIAVNQSRAWRVISTGKFGIAELRGKSVIVHAVADDGVTQPTGASGARVLCAPLN